MIPRRLAYRIWSACLRDQARQLRDLAAGRGADPRRGRAPDPASAGPRRAKADRLDRAATTLSSWIASGGPPGGDREPALVALVAAWFYERTEAWPLILERLGRRGARPSATDLSEVLRWILED